MMKNKKDSNFRLYNKTDLVQETSELLENDYSRKDIKTIIDCYERLIQEHLLEASPNRPIQVRPLCGLRLQTVITPEKTKDTLWGERIEVPEKILCKAKSTRYFTQGLNKYRNKDIENE